MISKARNLASNNIVSGTIIVTIGTFIGSFFSYVLQIGLGRLLTVSEYGEFNALLSLAVIFTVPILALTNSLIKNASELLAVKRFDILTFLYTRISMFAIVVGALVFVLANIFGFFIGSYLNINDPRVFLMFGLFLGISFLNIAPASYLQGLLRFKAFAFFSALSGFTRAVFGLAFVYFGLSVGGAYLGLAVSIVLMYFLGTLILKKNFVTFKKMNLSKYYEKILTFGFVTFFVGGGMTLLNNVDVVLAKHFFDSDSAGIYAAVVTIGKVLLFGAGTVMILMYPQISELHAKKEDFLPRFKQFLAIQLLLVLGGILTFSLFSELIVTVLFGEAFLQAIPFIPKFSVFVGIYIITNFLMMFLVATNNKKAWIFLVPAVLGQYILISFKHNNIDDIITANIAVSAMLLAVISLYCLRYLKNVRINNNTGL